MALSVSLNTLIEFGLVIRSEGKLMAQWLSYLSYRSYFRSEYDTYDRYDRGSMYPGFFLFRR